MFYHVTDLVPWFWRSQRLWIGKLAPRDVNPDLRAKHYVFLPWENIPRRISLGVRNTNRT